MQAGLVEAYDQENIHLNTKKAGLCLGPFSQPVFILSEWFHPSQINRVEDFLFWVANKHILLPVNSPRWVTPIGGKNLTKKPDSRENKTSMQLFNLKKF